MPLNVNMVDSNLKIIYSASYFLAFFMFLISYRNREKTNGIDFLNPILVINLLIFAYSFASGLSVEYAGGYTIYGDKITPKVLYTYYCACLLGSISLLMGAFLAKKNLNRKKKYIFVNVKKLRLLYKHKRKVYFLLSIILAIFLFSFYIKRFNFLHVTSYADNALSWRLEQRAQSSYGVAETFTQTLPITLILSSCILYVANGKRKLLKLLSILIFVAFVATSLLAGLRGMLVGALLMPIAYYHYRIKRINAVGAVIFALISYLLTSVVAFVRHTSDPFKMLEILTNSFSKGDLAFLSLQNSGELLTAQNLARQIKALNLGEMNYNYGMSIISEILVFIPRPIWPGRPLPLSEQFVKILYPSVWDSGGGYGFFCIQEGYWAGGLIGVVLFMSLYGYTIERIYQLFMRKTHSDFYILAYSAVFNSLAFFSVRSGIIGNFKALLISCLPYILIYIVFYFYQLASKKQTPLKLL